MSIVRGKFCGFCGKSEQNLVKEGKKDALKKCTRCNAIRYCHRACQRGDYEKHKKLCDSIHTTDSHLSKIEKTYEHFNLGSGPRANLYKEYLGDFWSLNNHNFWEAPPEGEPVWPRDYLKMKRRLIDGLFKVGDTNQGNYEAVEKVLDHFIELVRLDAFGGMDNRIYMAFTFLLLGRDQEAYDFICYYLDNPESPPKEDYKRVQRGQWLTTDENQDKFEDLSKKKDAKTIKEMETGFKLALLALKIGNMNELNENEAKIRKYEKKLAEAKVESDLAKFKENPILMECMNLYFIGDLDAHEESKKLQQKSIQKYLQLVHESNKTLLPAILEPQALLKKEDPATFTPGGVEEAREMARFMYKYFHRLPNAKDIIAKFLYPDLEPGKPYPKYNTTYEKVPGL